MALMLETEGGAETCCQVPQNGVYLQRRMIRFQFNSVKTTQAAAFLLERHNGSMSKGVLIKLLYLADRELLSRRGQPLTGDQPVSMENGPVLSKTYDLTKGAALEHRGCTGSSTSALPRRGIPSFR